MKGEKERKERKENKEKITLIFFFFGFVVATLHVFLYCNEAVHLTNNVHLQWEEMEVRGVRDRDRDTARECQ